MKRETSVQNLLFDVDQVPVEAVLGTNGHTRRINIPGKKDITPATKHQQLMFVPVMKMTVCLKHFLQ